MELPIAKAQQSSTRALRFRGALLCPLLSSQLQLSSSAAPRSFVRAMYCHTRVSPGTGAALQTFFLFKVLMTEDLPLKVMTVPSILLQGRLEDSC